MQSVNDFSIRAMEFQRKQKSEWFVAALMEGRDADARVNELNDQILEAVKQPESAHYKMLLLKKAEAITVQKTIRTEINELRYEIGLIDQQMNEFMRMGTENYSSSHSDEN